MGGLSKRAFLVDFYKMNQPETLLLDAGNILFSTDSQSNILEQDTLSANAIIDIYNAIGYDAMNIGPYDLSNGIDFLVESFLSGTPWISANLFDVAGNALFPPWVIRQTPEGTIGIIGLTSEINVPGSFRTRNWREILPPQIDELDLLCDFIIVLSNLDSASNAVIAESYPQIHLLLSTDPKRGNVTPYLINNTLMSQTHTRGKYLGVLNISWTPLKIWQKYLETEPSIVNSLLETFNTHVDSKDVPSNTLDSYGKVNSHREHLEAYALDGEKSQGGKYSFKFRSLPGHIEESPEINHRISKLKDEIASSNKKTQLRNKKQTEQNNITTELLAIRGFAGAESCRQCHEEQYTRWQQTHHSVSMESLKAKGQQYNINCLPCHVTSNINELSTNNSKTNLLNLPAQFLMVGCESCHGPGLHHVQSDGASPLPPPVSEATCRQCHTTEMDSNFQFSEKLTHLGCNTK